VTTHTQAVVIGAGISGLVCAYALRKAGIDVVVLEASPRAGGVIQSERRDGYLLEMGPQSFSVTDSLRTLFHELEIDSELHEAPHEAPRFVLVDGMLRSAPLSPQAFLTSSLFGAATKWSVARDRFGTTHPPEHDESVADFVRRKFTPELLDRLVGPFISGIFAGDPEQLSLRSAFPQLYEAEKTNGSIIRGLMHPATPGKEKRQRPTLMSFRDGTERFTRALAERLGSTVHLRSEGVAIRDGGTTNGGKFEIDVRGLNKTEIENMFADHVVLATPADVAGRLLGSMEPQLDALLSGIEYAPIAVVSLGYASSSVQRSLDGFGFLVPRSAGLRVLGTVWNSSLFVGRAPEGHILVTSFVGGATDRAAVELPSNELAALVHREIAPLLAIQGEPTFSNVRTYSRALPQYNLGHGERLAAIDELLAKSPNVSLTGNFLSGPAIGNCVEHARGVAERLVARISG
jgi:oxygen-dependent protoporphyrinogen oxidase